MDFPTDINLMTVLTWVAGSAVTLLVTSGRGRLTHMEKKHDALEKEYRDHLATLPTQFVSKDDYRADIAEIKGDLKSLLGHVMGRPNVA
jgi:hypothetical protein